MLQSSFKEQGLSAPLVGNSHLVVRTECGESKDLENYSSIHSLCYFRDRD